MSNKTIIVCTCCGNRQSVSIKIIEHALKSYNDIIHCLVCNKSDWKFEDEVV